MESVIKQLVKIGHGMGAEVANDEPAVAKLLVELSSALDVQYERANATEAKCAALAAENAGLNAFVDALLSIAWQGGSADGADIEELALKHGLIRQEVYSQDDHENLVDDPGNFEDGDPVYFRVETPATDAFLAEVRAQGVEMFGQYHNFSEKLLIQKEAKKFAAQLRKGAAS